MLKCGSGALDHLVLAPATASISAGGSQPYTATGYDAHNNSLGDVTATTLFSIVGGSCSANSCGSTLAGSHAVSGVIGAASGSATLTVTAGPLDHLVLAPATSSIVAGSSQSYTATGFDAYNNSRGDVTGLTAFTIAPDGSCTTNSCSATVVGSHTVTGTLTGKTGTASAEASGRGPVPYTLCSACASAPSPASADALCERKTSS